MTGIIRLSRHLVWILVKTWCRFDIEPIWVYIWCINRYIKVTRLFFNGLFLVDMACPRWWIILGRCWADVGPLAAMFSRLLGTFAWRIIIVVLHIAFCALCTHISMFVFICSLTIILCVLKTVQPTPLVVEPGRYNHCISVIHPVQPYREYPFLLNEECSPDTIECVSKAQLWWRKYSPTKTCLLCCIRNVLTAISDCYRYTDFCNWASHMLQQKQNCARFGYIVMHCGIWDWCIVGFV